MPGRKPKLTDNKADRKCQRDRTQILKTSTDGLAALNSTPPSSLVGLGAKAYTKIVNDLNSQELIKEIDVNVVIALARQIQIADSAYKHIYCGVNGGDPEGLQQAIYRPIMQGGSGGVVDQQFVGFKKNPAVATLDSATAKIKSLCESLGMTPTSRASLLSLSTQNDDDDDSDWRDQKSDVNDNYSDF